MKTDFWLQRWQNNEIGFHQRKANPLLVTYFENLGLEEDTRVFVPLCGKTLDIPWLLSRGHRVAGVELSELAVGQLFEELGVAPRVSEAGRLKRYAAEDIDIFVGDIFDLTADVLGPIDAVYDRAALVALPETMRQQYTRHLMTITGKALQFLITFEYDQSRMDGPPFSVSNDEMQRLYENHYQVRLAESRDIPGGLKGKVESTEDAWLLRAEVNGSGDK